jgi:BirA family transcriptional regulator, biotin operon repressor / biotin---[acetyl-CoA-carboxylase] ligase
MMERAPRPPSLPARPSALPPDFAEAVDQVRPRLAVIGSSVLFFPQVGSTNDVAAALAEALTPEGTVILADQQTAGRGRRGRQWFSPAGQGLYVSVLLAPSRSRHSPARALSLITLAAGVALAEAVETVTGLSVSLKWPNDLQVGRRKLAGILADGIAAEPRNGPAVSRVVLGYGIDVGAMAYPADLQDRATSLESELGRPVDRAALFAATLVALDSRYGDLLDARFDAILDTWRARAQLRRGARVTWETPAGACSGVALDVDEWGALLVRTAAGTERIVAGELHWD